MEDRGRGWHVSCDCEELADDVATLDDAECLARWHKHEHPDHTLRMVEA